MQVRDWSIRLSLWVGILLLVPLGLVKNQRCQLAY